ncbi:PREDICTED: single-stranded DNA-binding protein, mitochondrial isoform X2 [Lupinus angustifolius]|uniref:single-stranded DNA-binding protein, mitochondrial isoform X2 n=1 Tax=Lupinus angustifolius TaxID=3871 RepID=UPI00092F1D93|nr:PREDICTED: single-stranded DNA-binding protein, mitochondrial isoform X2 [Lupinus angustifolius]
MVLMISQIVEHWMKNLMIFLVASLSYNCRVSILRRVGDFVVFTSALNQAIICGKVGQAPVQKILRNGKNVTIFTVGTGGMYDQRLVGAKDMPKPAQWHRIAVHNDVLGAYAVQQLFKNSSVYVEGDIETRVYNDSINGDVKSIPEICIRRDGKLRLIKNGESVDQTSLDELREGLF